MNGYKMLADSYRKFLNDATADQDSVNTHIKALDFLAKCDKATIALLCALASVCNPHGIIPINAITPIIGVPIILYIIINRRRIQYFN